MCKYIKDVLLNKIEFDNICCDTTLAISDRLDFKPPMIQKR